MEAKTVLNERKMTNYIEQAAETTEADQAIQAHLRQACEHKIALHVDAAIDVVDTDPAEADAWAYEAGKEAWEFDIQTPEKLASHPALSAAFKRGFDSVEQQSRSQRDVGESSVMTIIDLKNSYLDAAADLRAKQADLANHADELHRFIAVRDQLQAHPDFSGYLPETYYSGGDLDPVGAKPEHEARHSSPSPGM